MNETWSRYVPLNTFNIPKKEGVNERMGEGGTKKPPENAMKLRESRI